MSHKRSVRRNPMAGLAEEIQRITHGHFKTVEFGCGVGAYLKCSTSPRTIGIEAFQPYAEEARGLGFDVVVGDMREYRKFISPPYSVALFIDSLEHLPKKDGEKLLDLVLEDFMVVYIFAPFGDHPSSAYDGNALQEHKSSWWPDDLISKGFRCVVYPSVHSDREGDERKAFSGIWERP